MTEQISFLLKIVEETSSSRVASRARELRLAMEEDEARQRAASGAVVPDAELKAMEPGAVARLVVEELRTDAQLACELSAMVSKCLQDPNEVVSDALDKELSPGGRITELVRKELNTTVGPRPSAENKGRGYECLVKRR